MSKKLFNNLIPRLKRCLKLALRFLLGFLLLLLAYILFAFILSIIPVNKNYQAAQRGVKIFITSNGMHADFTLPIQSSIYDWRDKINLDDYGLNDTIPRYVSFGWGDKKFYFETPTMADLTAYNACNAMLWNSASAMHVTLLKGTPLAGDRAKVLFLSEAQYQVLIEHILQAFEQNKDGSLVLLPNKGYSHKDRFYNAVESYNAINTCNFWVNKGLKKIGVKTSVWSPLDRGILYHLP